MNIYYTICLQDNQCVYFSSKRIVMMCSPSSSLSVLSSSKIPSLNTVTAVRLNGRPVSRVTPILPPIVSLSNGIWNTYSPRHSNNKYTDEVLSSTHYCALLSDSLYIR